MDEVLRKDLRGRDSIIDQAEAEQFFDKMKKEKGIYKSNDIGALLNELEQMFAEKLTSNQVKHIMELFRIFEGTPTTINNGLVKITTQI